MPTSSPKNTPLKTTSSILQRFFLSCGFYCSFFMATVFFILLSAPYVRLLPSLQRLKCSFAVRHLIWIYGHCWAWVLSFFVSVKIQGFNKPLPVPCIITPNHRSFFDPYCLGFWPHSNIVFLVRTWPFRIPIYGPCMKTAGYLNSDIISGQEFLEKAAQTLKEGVSVVVFPEGTRNVTTAALRRFRSGAFKLAIATNTPIVPLCIRGTGELLPKSSLLISPASISISALDPIYPDACTGTGVRPETKMRQELRKQLQEALQKN